MYCEFYQNTGWVDCLNRIFDIRLAAYLRETLASRGSDIFPRAKIEAWVLLDDRDDRLYASALPNLSSDFSTLGSHFLPSYRPSAFRLLLSLPSIFSRLRPAHNWFPSSTCRSFDEFFKMQRSGSDEGSTDVISVPSTPRLSASPRHIIFYQSSRTNLPCALHLLITNDKFALRLHWRDRTEANSRRRKCARGRCILPLPPPSSAVSLPLIQNFKNISGNVSFHSRKFNLLILIKFIKLKNIYLGAKPLFPCYSEIIQIRLNWRYFTIDSGNAHIYRV